MMVSSCSRPFFFCSEALEMLRITRGFSFFGNLLVYCCTRENNLYYIYIARATFIRKGFSWVTFLFYHGNYVIE